MTKGIIYYTDNRLEEKLFKVVQKTLTNSGLPITSVSLKPIDFGHNVVYAGSPSYTSMVKQIILALETSKEEYVFFCEHDVLYHKSHFDFTPPKNDVYYYNLNNWRWAYPTHKIIKYDNLTSLSQLCVNRLLALNHYKLRLNKMIEFGLENFNIKDPHQARRWGYEPARKSKKDGAILDEKSGTWVSEFPNIDIRHGNSFTIPKVSLKDFVKKPTNWKESSIEKIDGWNLKNLLKLD